MAKKKATTTKKVSSKKLYLLFSCMGSSIDSLKDFNDNEATVYTSITDAVESMDSDDTQYIIEVDVESVKTNRVVSPANLIEVKLK